MSETPAEDVSAFPQVVPNPLVPEGELHIVGATRVVIRDGRIARYVEERLQPPPIKH